MEGNSQAFRRAYNVCRNLLHGTVERNGMNVNELRRDTRDEPQQQLQFLLTYSRNPIKRMICHLAASEIASQASGAELT
jgi:hypothetical protein